MKVRKWNLIMEHRDPSSVLLDPLVANTSIIVMRKFVF
jgi:hypothetical protein